LLHVCPQARHIGRNRPELRRSIVNGRLETGKPVLLLDWDGDVRYLNNRISEYMTFGSVLPEGSTFPLQLG
jgi:hypothetical protein